MAEQSLPYVLACPGGTITFNTPPDSYYLSEPPVGLDGAPIRQPINNRAQGHGGLVHRALLGPRHMQFTGLYHVTSAASEPAYAAARTSMHNALSTALLSILAPAQGTLTWTPSGGSALHLYVSHDQPLSTSGAMLKGFSFGLVAAEPTPW